jgi:hypothetical protein
MYIYVYGSIYLYVPACASVRVRMRVYEVVLRSFHIRE